MLFVDRFLGRNESSAIDLATGRLVWLRWMAMGSVREQAAWSEQCDGAMSAPGWAPGLVDFGISGEGRRFEAWSGPPPWPPLVAQDPAHGWPAIDAWFGRLFEINGTGPRVLALQGPPGPPRALALARVARQARSAGFVPLAVDYLSGPPRLVGRGPEGLFATRSICLLADGRDARGDHARLRRVWTALLAQTLRCPRAHAAVVAVNADVAGLDRVLLPRMSGLVDERQEERGPATRASEQRAVYEVGPCAPPPTPRPGSRGVGTSLQVEAIRQQVDSAAALLASGRRAPGERALRMAVASADRRGYWEPALEGCLHLARALAARGRARDALGVLDSAARHAARDGSGRGLAQAAALRGRIWIDLGRLDDARQVLETALAAAAAIPEAPAALLRVELARCLWWQGRRADAAEITALSGGEACRAASIHARVELAGGHVDRALAWVRRAHSLGEASSTRAEAQATSAWVRLALDEHEAARDAAAEAAVRARREGEPIVGAEARILLAEALRRAGDRAGAGRALRTLNRLSRCLPPLLKAQLRLVADLAAARDSARALLERHVRESGLAGLVWLLPPSDRAAAQVQDGSPLTPCLVAVLEACQIAGDELAILRDACVRLRRAAGAAGVAVFVRAQPSAAVLASDGVSPEPAVAERALAAGVVVAARQEGPAVEGAPIAYGGEVIGALLLSWPLGSCVTSGRPFDALAPAAVAMGPVVAAVLALRRAAGRDVADPLVGASVAMAAVREAVGQAAAAPFPVLIEGESGSGKELVARTLHRRGPRADRPFVSINCAALPEDLVEAELFGHVRGAFTGAGADRAGVFEEAHAGTLFLDEVGELSARAQAKLLRAVQEGEVRRVGENATRRVDVRLVTATNRDLRRDADQGRFRSDLLYRLDVVRIRVPPLRERREDVPALVDTYWAEATMRVGSRASLTAATTAALTRYDWPGNVRELQNVLAALAVRCPKRGAVPPTALPPGIAGARDASLRLEDARRSFDEGFVRAALTRAGGRPARAAAELGVSRQGLTKLMKRLGIDTRA